MAASWVKIYLPQNYFAIRSVCENRWQIKLTGFSAESILRPDPSPLPLTLALCPDCTVGDPCLYYAFDDDLRYGPIESIPVRSNRTESSFAISLSYPAHIF